MSENADTWLAVIGRSLAYLCMRQAEKEDVDRFKGVLDKVNFLEGLGVPQDAAAEAAGSSAASVNELRRQAKKKKAARKGNGTKKKRK